MGQSPETYWLETGCWIAFPFYWLRPVQWILIAMSFIGWLGDSELIKGEPALTFDKTVSIFMFNFIIYLPFSPLPVHFPSPILPLF